MLNFLENHDEQRIASDFFAKEPMRAIPGLQVSAWMNTNPLMVYAGQELGEKGMDKEGFSGLDGRTTIFDYWSVDSLMRWRNKGLFDGKKLTKEQKQIRKKYIETIQLSKKEKCIVEGAFYDLMYANYENKNFNSTKQFVFLRCLKDEFLLIVSNFSDVVADITVNMPIEAFDFMKINPAKIKWAKELLKDKDVNFKESGIANLPMSVPANDSVVIKFSTKKI